jgi:hypothetical protein
VLLLGEDQFPVACDSQMILFLVMQDDQFPGFTKKVFAVNAAFGSDLLIATWRGVSNVILPVIHVVTMMLLAI